MKGARRSGRGLVSPVCCISYCLSHLCHNLSIVQIKQFTLQLRFSLSGPSVNIISRYSFAARNEKKNYVVRTRYRRPSVSSRCQRSRVLS
jgi:hypothetical protein